jgi:DNA-binding transcriptional MerR regulator
MSDVRLSIGEVASRIGLSFRTIRYYDEVGLVPPSAYTKGGHRLYSESDVDRLRLIMKMKPLDFTLQEMGTVLEALDRLTDPSTPPSGRAEARAQLEGYNLVVGERLRWLQERLAIAHDFRRQIETELRSDVEQSPTTAAT